MERGVQPSLQEDTGSSPLQLLWVSSLLWEGREAQLQVLQQKRKEIGKYLCSCARIEIINCLFSFRTKGFNIPYLVIINSSMLQFYNNYFRYKLCSPCSPSLFSIFSCLVRHAPHLYYLLHFHVSLSIFFKEQPIFHYCLIALGMVFNTLTVGKTRLAHSTP